MSDSNTTAQGWLTMDSAPKDGTAILLHVDWEPLTVVGYWGPGQRDHDGIPDDGSPQWRVRWDQGRIAGGYDKPTHWAPIPRNAIND